MQSSIPQSTPLPSCFGSQLAEYCLARRCAVCALTGMYGQPYRHIQSEGVGISILISVQAQSESWLHAA